MIATLASAMLDRVRTDAYAREPYNKRPVNCHAPAHQVGAYVQVCSACRTTVPPTGAVFVLQDAAFCEDCWHDLPISERDQVVREIALRDVPLS